MKYLALLLLAGAAFLGIGLAWDESESGWRRFSRRGWAFVVVVVLALGAQVRDAMDEEAAAVEEQAETLSYRATSLSGDIREKSEAAKEMNRQILEHRRRDGAPPVGSFNRRRTEAARKIEEQARARAADKKARELDWERVAELEGPLREHLEALFSPFERELVEDARVACPLPGLLILERGTEIRHHGKGAATSEVQLELKVTATSVNLVFSASRRRQDKTIREFDSNTLLVGNNDMDEFEAFARSGFEEILDAAALNEERREGRSKWSDWKSRGEEVRWGDPSDRFRGMEGEVLKRAKESDREQRMLWNEERRRICPQAFATTERG